MKKMIMFLFAYCIAASGFSMDNFHKLDVRLKMLLNKNSTLSKAAKQEYLDVFVKGDVNKIKLKVENLGGYVNTVTENILTAQIPINKILNVAESDAVSQIKLAVPVKIYNDMAIKNIRADKVHNGDSPLNSSYKGNGVIVGIIDSGVDWQHEDFRDPDDQTKSRILYIWDQNSSDGAEPTDFSYGTEWTRTQINDEIDGTPAGVVTHKDDDPFAGGHGTHVTGTAAGNLGIAPEADIISVSLNFEKSTGIVDGANYIFKKAAELGRPAVVNASLGGHFGPHDGSSAESQALDQLVKAASGRAFCAAAGNEGSDYIHYGNFEVQQQKSWTYYFGVPYDEETEAIIQLYMIVETEDIGTLSIAVGVDSAIFNITENGYEPSAPTDLMITEWNTIAEIVNDPVAEKIENQAGKNVGNLIIEAGSINSTTTEVYIEITDLLQLNNDGTYSSGLDLWKLYTKGSGSFHVWSEGVMSIPEPSLYGFIVDAGYHSTDNNFTVGMPGDANDVITVGAYTNREDWVDYQGLTQPHPDYRGTVGTLASFSSRGPTVDNRIKPEIVAPGHFVGSALSSYIENVDSVALLLGGKHIIQSGTSMASPVATGAVALLFENNPNYTNEQVRTALFDYTYKDAYVMADGALPNNLWGYGKLDIFAALTEENIGISDNSSTTIKSFELEQNYPNPFNPVTTIKYTLPKASDVILKIYNTLGQEIKTLHNNGQLPGRHSVVWDGKNDMGISMPSGIYVCKIETAEFTESIKMIMLK